jgi:hypothetical protein
MGLVIRAGAQTTNLGNKPAVRSKHAAEGQEQAQVKRMAVFAGNPRID